MNPTRTFRIRGLEGEHGRALLQARGVPVYCIDVDDGRAILAPATPGPARVVADFDSPDTLEALVDGRIHPLVAALQNRLLPQKGDRRFGVSVLLGLRASAPRFTEGGP